MLDCTTIQTTQTTEDVFERRRFEVALRCAYRNGLNFFDIMLYMDLRGFKYQPAQAFSFLYRTPGLVSYKADTTWDRADRDEAQKAYDNGQHQRVPARQVIIERRAIALAGA